MDTEEKTENTENIDLEIKEIPVENTEILKDDEEEELDKQIETK